MALAKVLVVDDDVAALASTRAILTSAGYTVDDACGGRLALRRLTASPPDVLITEILMPDGDGLELITAVKLAHRDMHIIGVTGRRLMGVLDLLDIARQLGADATLDKPLRPESLLATVALLAGEKT